MNTQLSREKSPSSNTGTENTDILLDYLSFTLKFSEESFNSLRLIFDTGEFEELTYGGMGYQQSASVLDGGRVFWHVERPEMGIHVRLNPKSLGQIEMTPIGLLNRVFDLGGKITRLDVAFDDLSGHLDMSEIYRKLLAGEVVTRWHKVTRLAGSTVSRSEKTADTVSVGSRASQAYLRIYDKKLEQTTKRADTTNIEHWVRVELELKGDKSQAFAKKLAMTALSVEDGSPAELCSSLLWGMIDFKDVDSSDSNKSRWETSKFWREFVQASSKLTLAIAKMEKTMDDSKEWVRTAISPTLAMIILSLNDDEGLSGYDFIMACIETGQHRMTNTQQRRLDLWNNQQEAKRDGTILPNK